MGNVSQWQYVQQYIPRQQRAVLEIGSKNYGSTAPFRTLFDKETYIGLDQEAGPGVDLVGDLSAGLIGLREGDFTLILCCSVLEHVQYPWLLARNAMRLLAPGGMLYVSAPWVWRYHPYPEDYWRFSWRGIEALFEPLTWTVAMYSTSIEGEFFYALPDADNQRAVMRGSRKYLPYLLLHMLGRKPGA